MLTHVGIVLSPNELDRPDDRQIPVQLLVFEPDGRLTPKGYPAWTMNQYPGVEPGKYVGLTEVDDLYFVTLVEC